MLIDMIHDNHGEPPFRTRFRDPQLLKQYGYEAIVIPDALAAVPSAYMDLPPQPPAGPNVIKPADREAAIHRQVAGATAAGMKIFFYGDALLLPRSIVEKRPQAFLCDDRSGRLCPGKPAVFEALADLIHELFDHWPQASGLVMRTGEVYPEATPHMIGSTLHATSCPTCRHLTLIDRLVGFIQLMHDTVIAELGRTYVHRAWQPHVAGLPNMHDDPTVYRTIADRLPDSDRLCLSFKFTRGDFRSGHAFNPCLNADDRPKWIEFQCEREFEGKGAFPNYQAPLWQQFLQQLRATPTPPPPHFSLWGWSRGGGWGGPYVQREEWIDANVYALARLYQDPLASIQDIATTWTAMAFSVAESSPPAPAITELLMLSSQAICKLLYSSVLAEESIAPWVRDDLLDCSAIWASALRVVELGKITEALDEKRTALQLVDRIRHVWELALVDLPNKSLARDLSSSIISFESFAGAVANLFSGFVRYLQWSRAGRTDASLAAETAGHLETAQAAWQLLTQRNATLPGAPSVFNENTLWDLSNDCLDQLQSSKK